MRTEIEIRAKLQAGLAVAKAKLQGRPPWKAGATGTGRSGEPASRAVRAPVGEARERRRKPGYRDRD